ncbi:MAG TPA: glutathione S-transferase N-terminal domain-containing protein [Steroidobacteraceae bacterium]
MTDLTVFPITKKWPAKHPDRLQLYAINSPNGVKASIMLEETGLPYEPHLVDFSKDDQRSPEFRSLNPYGKIPAIIDPDGPGGKPLALFESGAILLYLAEKTGKFLPRDPSARYETIQWVIFQVANIGPLFGQVGFFYRFEGRNWEDKRPLEHYVSESRKLLEVINARLETREWIMGREYTIADIAIFPLVRNLIGYYDAGDLVRISDFPHVLRALDAFLGRPAVIRGVKIPSREMVEED